MLTANHLRWGIPIAGSDRWIGGSIYLDNLGAAVRSLPTPEQPVISLLKEDMRTTASPLLRTGSTEVQLHTYQLTGTLRRLPFAHKFADLSAITRVRRQVHDQFDIVFPCTSLFQIKAHQRAVAWIPDFQHIHLPQYFSPLERRGRDRGYQRLAKQASLVVLSSQDARKDFDSLYPAQAHKVRVLSFATVPTEGWFTGDPQRVARSYGLPDVFAMIPNQFWMHKNHLCVFEALHRLRQHGKTIALVCTGFTGDYRNNRYFNEIRAYLQAHDLEPYVHILGLIPRADQIQLLRRAAIVIQPSLFEGWSTVVEDVRVLGKRVIVSNIAVHREQNVEHAVYFDPRSPAMLADLLMSQLPTLCPGPDLEREAVSRAEQQDRIVTFAKAFLQIGGEVAALDSP